MGRGRCKCVDTNSPEYDNEFSFKFVDSLNVKVVFEPGIDEKIYPLDEFLVAYRILGGGK